MPPVTPQDIPLEQSERATFTPASLASIEGAPSFVLRSPTKRDERHHRRLMREEGLLRHGDEAIRREVFVALEKLWSPEDHDRHAPRVREYFEALDQHRLQAKDDPELKFEWDADDQKAIQRTVAEAVRAWEPLRRMTADNAEANELQAPLIAAVVVESWSGLPARRELDRGYLSTDCAEQLVEDLEKFEAEHSDAHGLTKGTATIELFNACIRRLYLDEDAEKNSASPSPSPAPPTNSSGKKASGTSKAPASSNETPATV